MTSNHIFQHEESSEDFNEVDLSAQSNSNTDCSSSDRSNNDSDISILKIKPEDKDTIEKAKKALLARVRTQVSTSLMLPIYPYSEYEPGQSQDGVQRPK